MSKEAEQNVVKVNAPALPTAEELMKRLLDVTQQLADSQKQLGEAILESRKPYVDPRVLEQKRRDNEERKRIIEAQMREKIARKKVCPHIRDNGTPNIKWHQHSNNITLGVCGTCFSEFDTRNPDDLKLLRQDLKSVKNMARAGDHARRGAILEA